MCFSSSFTYSKEFSRLCKNFLGEKDRLVEGLKIFILIKLIILIRTWTCQGRRNKGVAWPFYRRFSWLGRERREKLIDPFLRRRGSQRVLSKALASIWGKLAWSQKVWVHPSSDVHLGFQALRKFWRSNRSLNLRKRVVFFEQAQQRYTQ